MEKDTARKPLIHCITNPIAMNQSANAILAIGGRPIMAEHPMEVAEITETADALLLNLGNISDIRMKSMLISAETSARNNIPMVIDAVGVACSHLRMRFLNELLEKCTPRVIKGNYSEIKAIYDRDYRADGIDAGGDVTVDEIKTISQKLASEYDSIILGTGEADIIASSSSVVEILGGCKQLGSITGTGCMLGAIVATYLAFDNSFENVGKACRFFKECGKKAENAKGSGSFFIGLMDALGENDEI